MEPGVEQGGVKLPVLVAEAPAQLSTIDSKGRHKKVHPADVRGRFMSARTALYTGLIAFYVALPFVHVGGHPAVHLDVAARRFYLFGATFNAQDFWLVVFLLTTVAFTLLFLTAWRGRLWCGWACPQTVFLEYFYRRVERWIDGPRERRLRRSQEGWTVMRIARGATKHALFLAISIALSHVALALFLSVDSLLAMIREGPAAHPVPFTWAVAVTGLLYMNFAWFREQLCTVVCPYGRLQSMMHDQETITVGYDLLRGEPRGKLLKTPVPATLARGDCVDCRRCVNVCPAGIDIRNGLQLECVACAQCVDACDEVMIKIGKPTGLIRYDSLSGFAKQARTVLRPRLYAYGGLMVASILALAVGLGTRTHFEANLLRMKSAPYVLDGDNYRNSFELHLVNKNPEPQDFTIAVSGAQRIDAIIPQTTVHLGSLQDYRMPIFISAPKADVKGPFDVTVTVKQVGSHEEKATTARFLAPMQPRS